jgi:hypothetical protein
MNQQEIEQTILKETQGLSSNALQEILHFIQFLKIKGHREAKNFKEQDQIIRNGLKTLEMDSFAHLEEEFTGYKELYPHE